MTRKRISMRRRGSDRRFWQEVFLVGMGRVAFTTDAALMADAALKAYTERFPNPPDDEDDETPCSDLADLKTEGFPI
jgi:hypothetical protein